MSDQENQSMKPKGPWRWWAKALGEKASKCDKESDRVAIIRTVIFATYLITNCFIIAGVIRQWNKQTTIEIFIENPHEVPSSLPKAQEENGFQANRNFL
jgi:hypothetical protein